MSPLSRPHGALALLALAALAALAAAPRAARAQSDDDAARVEREAFAWHGTVPAGRWLHVRNVNGPIRVERAAGDQIEVTAERRTRRGDPSVVRFAAQKARDGQGMVICAIWGDRTCDEDGYHGRGDWLGGRGDQVSIAFAVKLPDGVRLAVHTVNGGLEVRGAGSEVVARTTNGSIRAETAGGPVSARTTNGSINARMSSVGDARDLEFSTTNGSVTVEMPAGLGADVELSTVNGRVGTEFPVTVSGRIDPRRLRATVGDGSRRVRLRTVNGSVELRRAN